MEVGAPIDPELTADAEEGGDVGPLGAGAGTSLHRQSPRARQHRAVGRLSAGTPRLHKSCRLRRPQSKGRSCVSGRARRDPRARGGRRHLSERPGWPRGAPISRGSTVSMIAFGGRRGPHWSGSRCRGRPIERRERLGARGASGRMPLPRAGHPTARAVKASAPLKTAARRPCVVVVVVVVVAATPNYLRQASQNLGKYPQDTQPLSREFSRGQGYLPTRGCRAPLTGPPRRAPHAECRGGSTEAPGYYLGALPSGWSRRPRARRRVRRRRHI